MFRNNHAYYPPKNRDEWLKKMRAGAKKRRGIPLPDEVKNKLRLAKLNKPRKGKGGFKRAGGYKYIFLPFHPMSNAGKYYGEHRYNLEQYLIKNDQDNEALVEINGKKYLSKKYIVHHIDRNKLNNDPKNLMALTRDKHHGQLVTCPFCKKDFNY